MLAHDVKMSKAAAELPQHLGTFHTNVPDGSLPAIFHFLSSSVPGYDRSLLMMYLCVPQVLRRESDLEIRTHSRSAQYWFWSSAAPWRGCPQ